MLFEDQVEQFKEFLQSTSSRVQESSTFNNLRDRFNALSPGMQKVLTAISLLLIVFLVLASPIANYKASVESMASFNERKDLTQKIITYQKKSSSKSEVPKKYSMDKMRAEVDKLAKSYSINYTSEQVNAFNKSGKIKPLVPGAEHKAYNIKVKTSNIDQFATLAYSLQKANKSLLMNSIELVSSKEKPGYFDGSVELTNLYVKSISEVLPKPAAPKTNGKNTKSRNRRASRGRK